MATSDGIEVIRAHWENATTRLNPPQARAGHIAVAVDKRDIWGVELVVLHGGINKDKEALDDLAVLQCEQQEWLAIEHAPQAIGPAARAFHAAAVINNLVYIFGGHVYVKQQQKLHHFNDIWALDTDTWEWHRQDVAPDKPQPTPRDRSSLVALDNNRLLLFGGADAANRRLDDCWIFDATTAVWTEIKPSGPRPRPRCHASLFTLGNRVMLFGGDAYGGSNELWSLRGAIQTSPASAVSEKQLQSIQGVVNKEGEQQGNNNAIPASNTAAAAGASPGSQSAAATVPASGQQYQWTLLQLEGAVPTPRRGQACARSGEYVVVMGGLSEQKSMLGIKKQSEHQSDIFVLDRKPDKGLLWRRAQSEGPEIPQGREKHTLTALSSGRLLLFGGTDGTTTLGDAWWLNLEDVMVAPELLQIFGPDGQPPLDESSPVLLQPMGQNDSGSYMWNSLPAALQQGMPAALAGAAGLTSAISNLRGGLPLRWGGAAAPGGGPSSSSLPLNAAGGDLLLGAAAAGEQQPLVIPSVPDSEALADVALVDLGKRLLGRSANDNGNNNDSINIEEAVNTARKYLAGSHPSELRIRDVYILLGDYRRLARFGWSLAIQSKGGSVDALGDLDFIVPGRYMHFVPEEVRMKDVMGLQKDYRQLLSMMAGGSLV